MRAHRPALAVFLSAFLLFQVQPILAKAVLPWFGGGAGVWTTCVLFFQAGLLGGYLYAERLVRRLPPRRQGLLHAGLLVLSLASLPILPSEAWRPADARAPELRILLLLAATVGLPYLLLSATSPLLSAWYVRRTGDPMPYWLYAVSNAASLLALASYPFAVEPALSTRAQAWLWSGGYVLFVLVVGALALDARRDAERAEAPAAEGPAPGRAQRAAWVVLPALTSALLLAVTAHLTQNVAPVPFLWVAPLALFLLSFVACFARRAWVRPAWTRALLPPAVVAMGWGLTEDQGNPDLLQGLPLFLGGLLVACLAGHAELARLRPAPAHLLGYYLSTALGGALGALLVAVGAPLALDGLLELPLALAALVVAVPAAAALGVDGGPERGVRWVAHATAALCALVALPAMAWLQAEPEVPEAVVRRVRNFYGALTVLETGGVRRLNHGTITHGEQWLDPAFARRPISYYGPASGVGLLLRERGERGPLHVGVVGLGVGTLAAYGRAGDSYRFYELNPLVADLARRDFTYLRDCAARVDVVLGDGRLALAREPPQRFDVLAVDAFSSDSIPAHLLTREAFALYLSHLVDDGVLAVHVSNRHLALEPVVALSARALGAHVVAVDSEDSEDQETFGATWVLVSRSAAALAGPQVGPVAAPVEVPAGLRTWTDDHSHLLQVVRWGGRVEAAGAEPAAETQAVPEVAPAP